MAKNCQPIFKPKAQANIGLERKKFLIYAIAINFDTFNTIVNFLSSDELTLFLIKFELVTALLKANKDQFAISMKVFFL